MTRTAFRKILSANDVGLTGGHQGGVLIPKGNKELLEFLPQLDAGLKNPDAWIDCTDDHGDNHRFRFVYYNNKLHDINGTRNEYRITYLTAWFRNEGAQPGEEFEISREFEQRAYRIRIIRQNTEAPRDLAERPVRLRLKGWQRVH